MDDPLHKLNLKYAKENLCYIQFPISPWTVLENG